MERKRCRTGYDRVLPRKAIEGNEEVKEMLEKVWNKILKNKPLSEGFGRVVHIDKDTLNELKEAIEAENMEKVESILRELKYGDKYEFGRGKGIFRVEDIHSDSVEGVMGELRIDGSPTGRVIIELKTNDNPKIFTPEGHYKIVEDRWHWPYTGTGFISTRNGEILPEYYLKWSTKSGEMSDDIRIIGIKVIAEGGPYSLGW